MTFASLSLIIHFLASTVPLVNTLTWDRRVHPRALEIVRRKPGGGARTLQAIEEARSMTKDRVHLPLHNCRETHREKWGEEGEMFQDVFHTMTGQNVPNGSDIELVTMNGGYQNAAIPSCGVLIGADSDHDKNTGSVEPRWNRAAYQTYHNAKGRHGKSLKWVVRWNIRTRETVEILEAEVQNKAVDEVSVYAAGTAKFGKLMDTSHAKGAGHILSDFAITNGKAQLEKIYAMKAYDEAAELEDGEEEDDPEYQDDDGYDMRKMFWVMVIKFTD